MSVCPGTNVRMHHYHLSNAKVDTNPAVLRPYALPAHLAAFVQQMDCLCRAQKVIIQSQGALHVLSAQVVTFRHRKEKIALCRIYFQQIAAGALRGMLVMRISHPNHAIPDSFLQEAKKHVQSVIKDSFRLVEQYFVIAVLLEAHVNLLTDFRKYARKEHTAWMVQ
jgi:hypothetical protein